MERKETLVFLMVLMLMSFFFLKNIEHGYYKDILEYENTIYRMKVDSMLKDRELKIIELEMKLDSLSKYELNWENINYWLDEFGIKHKEIAKQQIFLETGNLSSDICLTNNNLFGMRYPRVRETTAIGARKQHAAYDNFVDSIRDYALWQQAMYDDSHDYYSFLTRVGYAECKQYISKLKYIDRNYTI